MRKKYRGTESHGRSKKVSQMIVSILAGMFGGLGGAIVALFATGSNLVAGDTLQKASAIATQIASLSLTLTVMLISSFCNCVSRAKPDVPCPRPRRVDYVFEESFKNSTVGTTVGTCSESVGVVRAPSEPGPASSEPTSAAEAAAVAT